MKLFLDTSVLLAASASASGTSRELFCRASANRWALVATPYVVEEVARNLESVSPTAIAEWAGLRSSLLLMDDVFTLDRPVIFEPAKDRPILFSALAYADALLTLDRADFGGLMHQPFYGLSVLTPGMFLTRERSQGRLL